MTSKIKPSIKNIFFVVAMFAMNPVCLALALDNNPDKELIASGEQGNEEAQLHLGMMYENDHTIPQDYSEAAKWYRKAAEQGNAAAQFHLGLLYEHGQGVPTDYSEAVKWFRKSAAQGNFPARYNLGVLYANGQGVAKDKVQADMWLSLYLAEAKNDQEAIKYHNELEKTMSPQQIAEGQRLTHEWTLQQEITHQPPAY